MELLAIRASLSRHTLAGILDERAGVRSWAHQARLRASLVEKGWLEDAHYGGLARPAEPVCRALIAQGRYVELAQDLAQDDFGRRPYHLRADLLAGLLNAEERAEVPVALLRQWYLTPTHVPGILELPPDLLQVVVDEAFEVQIALGQPDPALAELMDHASDAALDRQLLLRHGTIVGEPSTVALRGIAALIAGDPQAAAKDVRDALKHARKVHRHRDALLPVLEGVLGPLAMHLSGNPLQSKRSRSQIKRRLAVCRGVEKLAFGGLPHLQAMLGTSGRALPSVHPLGVLIESLVRAWEQRSQQPERLEAAAVRADALEWTWVADELRSLASDRPPLPGCVRLVSHGQTKPAWERELERIEEELVQHPTAKAAPAEKKKRLQWTLRHSDDWVDLSAREQSYTRKGWSKGRVISDARLAGAIASLAGATPQDLRIAGCLRAEKRRRWGTAQTTYSWTDKVWIELIGHPAVVNPEGASLQILRGSPRVKLTQDQDMLLVRLSPSLDNAPVVTEIPGAGFEVTAFTPEQRRAARSLGAGVRVPMHHRARLEPLLQVLGERFELSGHRVQVAGDPRPVVRLRPRGAGLLVEHGVQPGDRLLPAGQGAEIVLGQRDGKAVRVQRELEQERALAEGLEERLPALALAAVTDDERLFLAELHDALSLLEQLHGLGDQVVVQWPDGGRIQVEPAQSLDVSVRQVGGWFEADASLQVDAERVLALRELLALLEGSPGRFLRLDDGRFLALTASIRRQLDALARVSSGRGRVQVHPLASQALEPLVSHDSDGAWQEWQERVATAPADTPPPSTLQASLRGYQQDGFQWLARLAWLGVGACLADDMGLGKTVQALALVLHRVSEGPALVVAPTSVCAGWSTEARRFAPTLQVRRFGGGDRGATLQGLGPRDLVVCSYGLLVNEAERLSAIQWSTVILDEAQAIKNAQTRRHKAARSLRSGFRLALTGTPIENRLDEVHALFGFLNPGMLGSEAGFRKRFVRPIAEGDRQVAGQLRRLLTPTVLRRTKAQVLDELPSRTDVELVVDMDERSAAFYEALRQQAVETLEAQGDDVGHVAVLAQLTKLRLAACSPRLVQPGEAEGPKLAAFRHFVTELQGSDHRALVFSQFVKHLALLRAWLDARGVPYQYLDGSTPARARQQAVDAFQSGHGELFLISLKAGGTGLNLTGADYVLHMDPWWNPAVEDQASDRAHRMGQTRPVTVYRMVTRGTVEQRILELHRDKRQLADQLLSGATAAATLSAQELVALMRPA